jgi:hypothetical protein
VFFYFWACFGFFGHQYLFYQYAWALAPAAVWTWQRLRPAWQVVILVPLLIQLGQDVKSAWWDEPPPEWAPFDLPNGERLLMPAQLADDFKNLATVAAAANARPGHFVVVLGWGGGGFHYFYNPNYALRNQLVGCAAFRPYDEAELLAKLGRVDAIVLASTPADDFLRYNIEGKLRTVFSPALFQRIQTDFEPNPHFAWRAFPVLLKRKMAETGQRSSP